MGLYSSFREFFARRTRDNDVTRTQPIRPYERDNTGGMPINEKLITGLYRGTNEGLQFASPLAVTPDNVPVNLVSIPTPTANDDATKERLRRLIDEKKEDFPIIERTKCAYGTAWRWAWYDSKNMALVWEAIPDASVSDIEQDTLSGEINAIYTHDRFKVTTGENRTAYIERRRKITPEQVTVKWEGDANARGTNLSYTGRNVFGTMPIPFGRDCGENEHRGHSVLARNMRSYRALHEIELKRAQILADFNPKLNIKTTSVKSWLDNNGLTDILHANDTVFESRLYIGEKDDTIDITYLPSDATKPHSDAIKELTHKIVIGSEVPEIFWGTLATGNEASVDSHRDLASQYIAALRDEDSRPYERLFNDSLRILSFVEQTRYGAVTMGWGRFEMVSTLVKSQILANASAAISQIVTNAGGTKDDVLYFWRMFFPDLPETDISAFTAGIKDMAKHAAFARTDMYGQTGSNDEE